MKRKGWVVINRFWRYFFLISYVPWRESNPANLHYAISTPLPLLSKSQFHWLDSLFGTWAWAPMSSHHERAQICFKTQHGQGSHFIITTKLLVGNKQGVEIAGFCFASKLIKFMASEMMRHSERCQWMGYSSVLTRTEKSPYECMMF